MKAYMVFSRDPYHGCILVYAATATKARACSYNKLFYWDYIETSAHRRKDYDKFYDGRVVIETNEDLPKGAPSFYADEY